MISTTIESRFSRAEFRELCFSILEQAAWSLAAREPGRQPSLGLATTGSKRRDSIRENVLRADATFGGIADQIDEVLSKLTHNLANTDPAATLGQICELAAKLESANLEARPPAGPGLFEFAEKSGRLVLKFNANLERAGHQSMSESEWIGLSAPQEFLAAVTQMCRTHREAREPKTIYPPADTLALERGVQLVERGILPPRAFAPIQTSDLRPPFQTYLSFADPGPGHLEVTTRRKDLLNGAIVHIEYIDRDKIAEKSVTEAYRIPSIRHVARIRLVVGDETPCTVYIGRPVFESRRFENDILKSAHTIAAASSAMFGLGIADCKIALDGMTASEAITFMQAVAGNTIRDSATQRLSAAFNLNTHLTDDRDKNHLPKDLKERQQIARCSIVLASEGHFDKVTWDGAADGPSSALIPNQLSPLDLFLLVHEAHSRGLETYISAGMDAGNMGTVTEVGVGGVGIGTKLHFRDPESGAIGRVNDDAVSKVLANRDYAARQPPAQAASLLARLDWLYFEIHQTEAFASLRAQVRESRNSLFGSLEGYWKASSDADRISLHSQIQHVLDSARQVWRDLVGSISPNDSPGVLRPELRTLAASDHGTEVQDLRVHPLTHKALLFIAAALREEELRHSGVPVPGAPLMDPKRVLELQALVKANDLVGIQSWFLNSN